MHEEFPLLYLDSHALRADELTVSDGLFLSVDLSGPDRPDRRATAPSGTACRSTSAASAATAGATTGSRCIPRPGSRIVLEPEVFYLLLSAEGVVHPARRTRPR